MQGLVTLDFGNSNPHAGVFQKLNGAWKLIQVVKLEELNSTLKTLDMSPHNTSMVLSEVKSREEIIHKFMEEGYLLTRVKDYWRGNKFAGMPVNYSNTLGEDRLIEAFYAFKTDKRPTLLIDAGTFVTMDVVNENGFQGGYILPGENLYFKTFSHGEKLKNVSWTRSSNMELPTDTTEAISSGYSAFLILAQEILTKYEIQKILLTGGGMDSWKSSFISAKAQNILEERPHFIHEALKYWWTTQIEQL
jgi:type III pantothenate kinase